MKQIEGKTNKHIEVVNGIECWKLYSGQSALILPQKDRNSIIKRTHEALKYRGLQNDYYYLRELYFCLGVKKDFRRH